MIESLEINEKLIISDHIFEVSEEIPILKDYKHVKHPEIKVFSKDYEAYAYPEFGIFIWRNESEYLSIRCGPVGQNGVGGHSHYDQLSIECLQHVIMTDQSAIITFATFFSGKKTFNI